MNSIKTDNYWSFWCQGWSNHQNQEVLWWNRAFEAVEAIEAAEADEVNEVAEVLRPEKSLLRTPESWGFLNSALFWCFETKNIIEESWNIILNFSTFHVGGCWGQLMLLFWKLVQETQMSTPLEATRHHISTQLLVLLHLRAIYFSTFQYETPCTTWSRRCLASWWPFAISCFEFCPNSMASFGCNHQRNIMEQSELLSRTSFIII